MFAWLKYLAILGLVSSTESGWLPKLQIIFSVFLVALNIIVGNGLIFVKDREAEVSIGIFINEVMAISIQFLMAVVLLEAMLNYAKYFVYNDIVGRLDAHLEYAQQHHISLPKYVLLVFIGLGSMVCTIALIMLNSLNSVWITFTVLSVLFLRAKTLLLIYLVDHMGHYLTALAENLRCILACRTVGQYAHQSSLAYLLEQKQFYHKIYQLNMYFNEMYCWSVLGLIGLIFLDLICNLYWIVLTLLHLNNLLMGYFHAARLLPNLVFLVAFCLQCEYCKQQHLLICTSLRRLMRSNRRDPNTYVYNEFLEEFLIQVQQNKIVISAMEFMRVDLRLLMLIFIALVSSTVLLLQFHISELEQNKEL